MLSKEDYWRARKELADKPIHLSLLEYLWPLVKDFDFETSGKLELKQPEHELRVLAPISKGKHRIFVPIEDQLVGTGKIVRYSHRTIRHTLSSLGLTSGNKFSDGYFRIRKKKTKT